MRATGPILVVGGGIAGMTAALCLQRAGAAVELVERDADWRALGAGLTLNGATLRALSRLGLMEGALRLGASGNSRQLRRADDSMLFDVNSAGFYGPGIPMVGGILRPDFHRYIQGHVRAAGIPVRLGVAVDRVSPQGTAVTAHFSDGTQCDYPCVIGADGSGSTLRAQLFPEFEGPRYTGQGCWRAVLPRPAEVLGTRMYFGHQMVGINPVSATHLYLFLLQNLPERTWIAPEEWLPRLREQLQEFGGLIAWLRGQLSDDSQINYRPLDAYMLPAPWHRNGVLLLGDAVHGTTPHAGFGAGLCIEDAMILGELYGPSTSVDDWFARFMARRFERCDTITRGTIAVGQLERQHVSAEELSAAIQRVQALIVQEP